MHTFTNARDGKRCVHRKAVRLRDGEAAFVRPFVREDAPRIIEGFRRLSPESRRRRFFISTPELPPEVLDRLIDVDGDQRVVLVAVSPEGAQLGGGRYIRHDEDPTRAELSVTVADEHQGRGLGTVLVDSLIETARANGVRVLDGHVLDDNGPMRQVLRNAGAHFSFDGEGALAFEIDLAAPKAGAA